MPNGSRRRVAALYDVHGNLPALDATLEAVRAAGVDAIVVGGDVLPGPMPRACLERLRALDVPTSFLLGDGDRETLAARRGEESATLPAAVREALRWCAGELTPALADWVATWPATVRAEMPCGTVLFCHATPTSDVAIVTTRTPDDEAARQFGGHGADVVVCGHTHMAYDRHIDGAGDSALRVVNAGSVGMPFGEAGAHWLLLDDADGERSAERRVQRRHTPYDLSRAAALVRATRYPQAEEFAATNVLRPPSTALMLDRFTPSGARSR